MEKPVLADVVALSKNILHRFLEEDPSLWFDTLSSKSVFVANGEDIIVGAKQITGRLGDDSVHITSFYTFVFKLIGKETKLIYEHTSYEYYQEKGASTKIDNLPIPSATYGKVKKELNERLNGGGISQEGNSPT